MCRVSLHFAWWLPLWASTNAAINQPVNHHRVVILKGLNQQHEESEKDCQIPLDHRIGVENRTCRRDLSQRREGVAGGLRRELVWRFCLSPPPTSSTFQTQYPSSHPVSLIRPQFPPRQCLPPPNSPPIWVTHHASVERRSHRNVTIHLGGREESLAISANLALILCVCVHVCQCVFENYIVDFVSNF